MAARRACTLVLVCALVLALVPPPVAAAPTEWWVDPVAGDDAAAGSEEEPLQTITEALDRAAAGDTVCVMPGRCSAGETFPIMVKDGVEVCGVEGPAVTVVDGDDVSDSVFHMDGDVAGTAVRGLTVVGASNAAGSGGGIRILQMSAGVAGWPQVSDCVISGNEAASGAGIYVEGASDAAVAQPTITRCEITGNLAHVRGGGLDAHNHSAVHVVDCIFTDNIAESSIGGGVAVMGDSVVLTRCYVGGNEGGAAGGGVGLASAGTCTVRDCEIRGNEAGAGGGLYVEFGRLDVDRTIVAGNAALTTAGGGVGVDYGATAVLLNSLIIGNSSPGSGAGLCAGSGTAAFVYTTIADNTSPNWDGIFQAIGATMTFDGCIVWHPAADGIPSHAEDISVVGYDMANSCVCDTDVGAAIDGVIHDDPAFIDPLAEDYRLSIGSPCIDSATWSTGYPQVDLVGAVRPADGDADGVAGYDMGSHERPLPQAVQLAGATRYETACEIARARFGSADSAVIAWGGNFPDALAASGLAGALEGPLLLTKTDSLPASVADTLDYLGVNTVYIVGGTAVVNEDVEDELEAAYTVHRVAGSTRYDTAAEIANVIEDLMGAGFSARSFVARGDDFPDALALGPLAYSQKTPLLLTRPTVLPQATSDVIGELGITGVLVAGGEAAVSGSVFDALDGLPSVTDCVRVQGADRYATAVGLADYGIDQNWCSPERVGIATGLNFPDALGGGVAMGACGGELLLVKQTSLPPATQSFLELNAAHTMYCDIFGGPDAVAQGVRDAVEDALGW